MAGVAEQPVRDGQGLTEEEFRRQMFEFELCEHCGLDDDDHDVSLDMFGNWHAWCQADGEDDV
jgi:hypothetical protein